MCGMSLTRENHAFLWMLDAAAYNASPIAKITG